MATVHTPNLSAADRRTALTAERNTLASHLETVRAKRDSLPPNDPGWRRANRELRDVTDELAGYDAALAALAPEVEAEIREAGHAAEEARHQQAVAALAGFIQEAAAADVMVARLLHHLWALSQKSEALVTLAGLDAQPWHLSQPTITLQRLTDIIVAKAVLLRGGAMEELPALFQDELHPARAAQAATAHREAARLAEVILANSPASVRADRARIAAANAERRRREEQEARTPPKQLPAPPPMVFGAAVVSR